MIDPIDLKILELLKKDSRISRQEIADKLSISRQTVHNRIKILEENDVILQYTCLINDKKLGKEVTTIILIILDRAASVWKFTAEKLLDKRDELDLCEMHHLAGEYDVMLKMKTDSIASLEKNLAIITSIKVVQRTHTMVCLSGYESGFQL